MTSTARTTELEAVNTILRAIDEAPVQALTVAGIYPLEVARDALSEASRITQDSGWMWNTTEDYTASPANDGTITLPPDTTRFTADREYNRRPVLRGGRLVDQLTGSSVFTSPVTGTIVEILPWDDLPQAARYYITILAAKLAQGRSSVSSETYRYTDADLQRALLPLQEMEQEAGHHNVLSDNAEASYIVYGRGAGWV